MKAVFLSIITLSVMCSSSYAINFTSNKPMTTTQIELVKSQEVSTTGSIQDSYGLDSQNKRRLLIRRVNIYNSDYRAGTVYFYAVYNQDGSLSYSSQEFELEKSDYYRISSALSFLSRDCKVSLSINDQNLKLEEVKTNCKL